MNHLFGCKCERCMAMVAVAAIIAMNPDGSFFFTDEELERLVLELDAEVSAC